MLKNLKRRCDVSMSKNTVTINQKTWQNKLAKVVRVITIPPILVSCLIAVIYFFKDGVFASPLEGFLMAFFLGIFPVLAYPFQYIIPPLRKKGRRAQRKLAFVFTIIGYTAGILWAHFFDISMPAFLIMFSYFFAALILAGINLFTKIHASGHACSAAGVLIYTVYFFGAWALIFDAVLALLIVWASIKMKRHNFLELAAGAVPSFLAFVVGYLIF